MDNLARQDTQGQEIDDFLHLIASVSDGKLLDTMCHEFLYRFPPQRGLELAAAMTWTNPFFVPDIPGDSVELLALDPVHFSEMMMRAKLTAIHGKSLNVLVACAPKSASTFIQGALRTSLGLNVANLFAAASDPDSIGARFMEQEPDELALIRNGLQTGGYVAQHHTRCSPYAARLLGLYKVKTIVTHRNILDTLVSLDDMVMETRAANPDNANTYFNDAMPANYTTFDREDRLMMLAQRMTVWLVQFYISWKKCERAGLIEPLWISYENDFLGDKHALARRISTFLGPQANPLRIVAALEDTSDPASKRINRGISGRGRDVPASVRDQVMRMVRYYRDEEDISALIGE